MPVVEEGQSGEELCKANTGGSNHLVTNSSHVSITNAMVKSVNMEKTKGGRYRHELW